MKRGNVRVRWGSEYEGGDKMDSRKESDSERLIMRGVMSDGYRDGER